MGQGFALYVSYSLTRELTPKPLMTIRSALFLCSWVATKELGASGVSGTDSSRLDVLEYGDLSPFSIGREPSIGALQIFRRESVRSAGKLAKTQGRRLLAGSVSLIKKMAPYRDEIYNEQSFFPDTTRGTA